jgi:hypothetical protein
VAGSFGLLSDKDVTSMTLRNVVFSKLPNKDWKKEVNFVKKITKY